MAGWSITHKEPSTAPNASIDSSTGVATFPANTSTTTDNVYTIVYEDSHGCTASTEYTVKKSVACSGVYVTPSEGASTNMIFGYQESGLAQLHQRVFQVDDSITWDRTVTGDYANHFASRVISSSTSVSEGKQYYLQVWPITTNTGTSRMTATLTMTLKDGNNVCDTSVFSLIHEAQSTNYTHEIEVGTMTGVDNNKVASFCNHEVSVVGTGRTYIVEGDVKTLVEENNSLETKVQTDCNTLPNTLSKVITLTYTSLTSRQTITEDVSYTITSSTASDWSFNSVPYDSSKGEYNFSMGSSTFTLPYTIYNPIYYEACNSYCTRTAILTYQTKYNGYDITVSVSGGQFYFTLNSLGSPTTSGTKMLQFGINNGPFGDAKNISVYLG